MKAIKKTICVFFVLLFWCAAFCGTPGNYFLGGSGASAGAANPSPDALTGETPPPDGEQTAPAPEKKDFIKWVDLNASEFALSECLKYDIKYHNSDVDFHFVPALSYLAMKNGNRFRTEIDRKNLNQLLEKLRKGEKMADLLPQNKYTKYYLESFEAVFGTYLGDYTVPETGESGYGLRCYFPLASGYWFSHYDDFGSSRSFGYKRRHLGHDLMGGIGTPIIAVESGTVSEIGWNRFGGWRVGIRSLDTRRYYYYAHLRKDRPYALNLKLGDTVKAGQVIGYLGRTGYSSKENTNLQTGQTHLHFGLQLIFDPSQEQGNREIWVDCYALTKFLSVNRAKTVKDETKEHTSVNLREWKA